MMTSQYPTGPALVAAQERFEALVRRGVFRPCERFVCRDADREDRVAEGIAAAWEWYAREAARGHEPDVALAVHVVRLRTVDRSRRFVRGDGTRWGVDVYVQQQRGGLELRRLDGVHDHDDEDDERHEDDPSLGLARFGVNNPEANWLSAMDLEAWLDALPSTDCEMVVMRGAGFELKEIADVTGRSVAGVFRRVRQLGRELADRAGIDVDDKKREGRAGPNAVDDGPDADVALRAGRAA